jgi:hypothetical protein
MEEDTKPKSEKCCSRCGIKNEADKFIKNRNICKVCSNNRRKEIYNDFKTDDALMKTCKLCEKDKLQTCFMRNRPVCKDCHNDKRRNRYNTNEEHRTKAIKIATEYKQKKAEIKHQIKLQEIGENNKKCNYCHSIKEKSYFRHNRLKCKDCERDDPLSKFKRNVRSRIYIALKQNKEYHTIKYLGATSNEYIEWMLYNDNNYVLENQGSVWHIDHVIPISKFNLENKEEQFIAFNWRNTMPLSVKENLSKNNKLLTEQIEQHFEKLKKYHSEKNITMPQEFIDLFAKYLDAGSPLEPSLPLANGNICEELG